MIPVKYGYIFFVSLGLIGWLYIFFRRKDLRRMMFSFSFVFAILGILFSAYWFTIDWWHPATITGTRIGTEDFISGFAMTGVTMAIYAFFFKKKILTKSSVPYRKLIKRGLLMCSYFFATYLLIFFFHLPTFYSVYLSSFFASIIMFIYRRDLLLPGIITGLLMVICMIPIYWVVMIASPHWIQATYDFNHLSGILFTGIPIEELIFFFLWGMFLGPFYEFWLGTKFESV